MQSMERKRQVYTRVQRAVYLMTYSQTGCTHRNTPSPFSDPTRHFWSTDIPPDRGRRERQRETDRRVAWRVFTCADVRVQAHEREKGVGGYRIGCFTDELTGSWRVL